AGAHGKDALEAFVECGDAAWRGLLPELFQRLVITPDQIAHRLHPAGLPRCGGHQLLQQALAMDPAQGMIADPEGADTRPACSTAASSATNPSSPLVSKRTTCRLEISTLTSFKRVVSRSVVT